MKLGKSSKRRSRDNSGTELIRTFVVLYVSSQVKSGFVSR
jgi:hypothetical protein